MMESWYGQTFGIGLLAFIGLGLIAIALATALVVLKGMALWTAAKRDEKWWFIALLVLNTIGILELVYLIFVAKRWSKAPVMAPSSSGITPPPAQM